MARLASTIGLCAAFLMCIVVGCRHEVTVDKAGASLASAEELAKKCLLFAHLHQDHRLPQHFAWLFYDPVIKGEGVRLNLYTTSTSLPVFHTDWTPSQNWQDITAEVDRCSDYVYLGAGLHQPAEGDKGASDVVLFYTKSQVLTSGYIVGQLDGKARFVAQTDLAAVLAISDKLRTTYSVAATQTQP